MINIRLTVLLPFLLCPVALWSQTTTCGLQHEQHSAQHRTSIFPILSGDFTDRELEASLTRSYQAIFSQTTSPEQTLHTVLDLA